MKFGQQNGMSNPIKGCDPVKEDDINIKKGPSIKNLHPVVAQKTLFIMIV